jgi:hypothetical protein
LPKDWPEDWWENLGDEPVPPNTLRITVGVRPWFYFVETRNPEEAKQRRQREAESKQQGKAHKQLMKEVREKYGDMPESAIIRVIHRDPDGQLRVKDVPRPDDVESPTQENPVPDSENGEGK